MDARKGHDCGRTLEDILAAMRRLEQRVGVQAVQVSSVGVQVDLDQTPAHVEQPARRRYGSIVCDDSDGGQCRRVGSRGRAAIIEDSEESETGSDDEGPAAGDDESVSDWIESDPEVSEELTPKAMVAFNSASRKLEEVCEWQQNQCCQQNSWRDIRCCISRVCQLVLTSTSLYPGVTAGPKLYSGQ